MSRFSRLVGAGTVLWACACRAEYMYLRAIGDGALARDELVSVSLDEAVFAATRDGFPDLRVEDGDGHTVPFLLERKQMTQTILDEKRTGGSILSLDERPDNSLELITRPAAPEFVPAWIEFETPLHDFEKHVTVWGRAPDGTMQLLTDGQPIFDHSRFADVRNLRVLLADAGRRFPAYRVLIGNVTDVKTSALAQLTRTRRQGADDAESIETALHRRDFRIDRLWFGRVVPREGAATPLTTPREVTLSGVTHDPKAKRTEVLVASARTPLTSLTLVIADRNFSRQVTVEAGVEREMGGPQWHVVGSGRILDLSFRNLQRQVLTVSIRESRAVLYRLAIEDRDSPPLSITGIDAAGPVYRVIFLGETGRSYRLLYGDAEAAAPQFEREILEAIRTQKGREMLPLELGSPQESGTGGGSSWLRLLNTPAAMGAAAVLAVLVLGFGIFRALKHIDPGAGTGTDD